MRRVSEAQGWGWLLRREAWIWLWVPIIVISVAHYSTGAAHHWAHDILRRLYYIPIVVGAFLFGLRGSLAVSVVASLIYSPHAFTHMFEHDPGGPLEKLLEIVLYNLVALITGILADREHAERRRQEATSEQLRETLSEMKSVEQQLIRAGRLQSLGELTAGLAHEIKNPLASLKGTAEILSDEIAPDSPRRRMLEIHKLEIDRLAELLERFLSFARPRQLETKDVNLCGLIDRTISLIEPQAARHDVAVEWRHSPEPITVCGDANHIQQVVMNLALNAAQASPPGEKLVMTCAYVNKGRRRYGLLAVDDAGQGVPDDLREQIFNPFFTTKEGGTGLGLSIAARIVDQHQGFLEVERNAAGGASFRVLLPAPDCNDARSGPAAPS